MVHVLKVSATDFSRGFGKYRDEVHSAGVIEITSHDRVVGAYISPKELEHFRRLKQRERQAFHVSEVDDDLLSSIENAEYGEVSE